MKNRLIALLVLFTVILFSSAQAQTTAHKFESGQEHILAGWKTICGEGSGVALYPYPASLLGVIA